MRRGTTPTVRLTVKSDLSPIDLTGYELHVTFESDGVQIVKRETDLDISIEKEVTVISVKLSQEDTLAFDENRKVRVQLRAKDREGNAIASGIAEFMVREILEDGVI